MTTAIETPEPEAAPVIANPYVGPRAYRYGERLFGRDREVAELLDIFVAERIVLLHAPSGAGKTSLINAGLRVELEKEGFKVWPTIRVGHPLPPDLSKAASANRYMVSVLLSLEDGVAKDQLLTSEELGRLTLAEYLDLRHARTPVENAEDVAPLNEVLIFDQFEEILRIAPTDREARDAFFRQLGMALRRRDCWALFSMREEYVGALEPYVGQLPSRLAVRYRLDLLQGACAYEAVQKPAQMAGVEFTNEAAAQVIDNLRMVRIQTEGEIRDVPGTEVEPVHLQLVCRRLWTQPRQDPTKITPADITESGDVDSALESYYVDQLALASAESGTTERELRDWFDHHLITEHGVRNQVMCGQRESGGLPNEVIYKLVDSHLVRAEERRSVTWFELAHDRLLGPVRRNNVEWYDKNLTAFQRAAAVWDERSRAPGLLLRGEVLREAEQWAATGRPNVVEKEFLDESRRARRVSRQIRYSAIAILILSITVAVIAAVMSKKANDALLQATEAEKKAQGLRLAATAVNHSNESLDLAILLALEANRRVNTPEARGSLLSGFNAHVDEFLHGHTDWVRGLAFSPNGLTLASGAGSAIRLWNVDNKHLRLPPLTGHEDGIFTVTFSPDGSKLASSDSHGKVILWNVATGAVLHTIAAHDGSAFAVSFSSDGRVLASAGEDGKISLWDVATGTRQKDILGHEGDVYDVLFGPGDVLASAGRDMTVRLWDPKTSTQLAKLEGHTEGVFTLAFSPDGSKLASGGSDMGVIVWDVATRKRAHTLRKHTNSIFALAFTPDGSKLASGTTDKSIHIWNVEDGTFDQTLTGYAGAVYSLAFNLDGKLASGSSGPVILWDVVGYEELGTTLFPEDAKGDETPALEVDGSGVAFSPDGKLLAAPRCESSGGSLLVWEIPRQSVGVDRRAGLRRTFPLPNVTWCGSHMAFNADGSLIAQGSGDGRVLLWDTAKSAVRQELTGHPSYVTSVAFPREGPLLASASCAVDDWQDPCPSSEIRLWSVGATEPQRVLKVNDRGVRAVAFSPDGKRLASGGDDGAVRLWDTSTGNEIKSAIKHERTVWSVAFSPDGKWLVSGSQDASIILWDASNLEQIGLPWTKHTGQVTGLAFSPDSSVLASGGSDGEIRIWDIASRQPIGRVGHIARGRMHIAFNQDGKTLASRTQDGMVNLWDMDFESWRMRACVMAGRNLTRPEWKHFIGDEEYTKACAAPLVIEADEDAIMGRDEQAKEKFRESVAIARQSEDFLLNNSACWFGTINGHADLVLPACDRAVDLMPDEDFRQANVRDSRGVARAITGDFEGAIKDFEFFVQHWNGDQKMIGTRKAWITELRAKRIPFDAATLKALRDE